MFSHRLIVCIALFASIPAQAIQECELNGESVNPANGHTTNGKSGIMICRDKDSGQVQREQELKNGKFMGKVRYFRNGRLEREFSVNDKGNREGLEREYDPAGNLVRESHAQNGRTIGLSRSWHADGGLKRAAFNSDDGQEQAYAEFSAKNQLKELRCTDRPVFGNIVDDLALCGHKSRSPGIASLYGDDGGLRGKLTHLAGKLVGDEYYWENGKPRAQSETQGDETVDRNFSRDGVKLHEVRWQKQERGRTKLAETDYYEGGGQRVRERRWERGQLTSDKHFYLNGQPKNENTCHLLDGKQVCRERTFHDNGKLASEGEHVMSRAGYRELSIGTHRSYDSDGRVRRELQYDAAGKIVRQKEFDEGNRLVRDDEVYPDESRKAFSQP